jgi:hypothetical protein
LRLQSVRKQRALQDALTADLDLSALTREMNTNAIELLGEQERLAIDVQHLDRIEAVAQQVETNHFYR